MAGRLARAESSATPHHRHHARDPAAVLPHWRRDSRGRRASAPTPPDRNSSSRSSSWGGCRARAHSSAFACRRGLLATAASLARSPASPRAPVKEGSGSDAQQGSTHGQAETACGTGESGHRHGAAAAAQIRPPRRRIAADAEAIRDRRRNHRSCSGGAGSAAAIEFACEARSPRRAQPGPDPLTARPAPGARRGNSPPCRQSSSAKSSSDGANAPRYSAYEQHWPASEPARGAPVVVVRSKVRSTGPRPQHCSTAAHARESDGPRPPERPAPALGGSLPGDLITTSSGRAAGFQSSRVMKVLAGSSAYSPKGGQGAKPCLA